MHENFKSGLSHVAHGVVVAWAVVVMEKSHDIRVFLDKQFEHFDALEALVETLRHLDLIEAGREFGLSAAVVVVIGSLLVGGILMIEWLLSSSLFAMWSRDKGLRRFEGLWVQKVTVADRPYSIGRIEYDAKRRRWRYSGVGFDKDLIGRVKWETHSLWFDHDEHVWYFAGFARFFRNVDEPADGEQGKKTQANDRRYNVVPMLELQGERADALEGTVADIGADDERKFFDLKMRHVKPRDDRHKSLVEQLRTVDDMRSVKRDDLIMLLTEAGIWETAPKKAPELATKVTAAPSLSDTPEVN